MEPTYIIEPPQVTVTLVFEPEHGIAEITLLIDNLLAVWRLNGINAVALIDHLTSQDIDAEVAHE